MLTAVARVIGQAGEPVCGHPARTAEVAGQDLGPSAESVAATQESISRQGQ